MSAYEQMKNLFLTELDSNMPELTANQIVWIGKTLDKAAYSYSIANKGTSLVIAEDPIPALVKTYVVIKKTEGLSNDTLKNYANILKVFFLWAKKQPCEITANDIRMFIYEYKTAKGVSDRTLDKYREFICWFFHWAHAEEYIPHDPARSIKSIKYEQKERQALSQTELEYLRMACRCRRDRAVIEFLYSTGCRVSELCNVKLSDIDWQQGSVRLFGKGKKHRTSFINAKCEVALREYLKERTWESEWLFASERTPHGRLGRCTIENIVKLVSDNSEVTKKVTPHILRHTTATQAVNNGMPIEDVSKLLGHSNVSTTMIYAKVSHENVRSQHSRCVI